MRIVGGTLRGRPLRAPRGLDIRPTADRVREAWFNILGPRLPGARVLDLFAGSGALGLEALSRGAAAVTFVERHPAALRALSANVRGLGMEDHATVRRQDALALVATLDARAFDIALADPPYQTDEAALLVAAFRRVPFADILAVEHHVDRPLTGDDTRRYGSTALTFCYAP